MVEEQVTIVALLDDEFTRPLRKLTKGLTSVLRLLGRIGRIATAPFRAIGRGLAGLAKSLTSIQGLLIGGGAAGIITVFGRFEEQMTQVATLVDTAEVNIQKLGRGIQEIAIRTGDSLTALTKGLFDAISAGTAAGDSLEFLEAASRLAAGGGTTTAEAIDGLTTIINSYSLSAKDATEVTDSFFKAMEGGKITIGEFTRQIGIVAKTANSVGLSVDELTGSIAVLTKGGIPVGQSFQALNSLLQAILKPLESAKAAASSFGIELSTTALRSKGLVQFMQEIAEVTGGVDTALQSLFPNQRAFRAALVLSANDAEFLTDQMQLMAEKAGATDLAFGKVSKNLFFQLRQVKNLFLSVLITIGEAAKPFLEDVIGSAESGKGLAGFLQTILDSRNQVQSVIMSFATSIQLLVNVVKEAFDAGDITTLLVNAFASALTAVAQTIVAALPLLLNAVTFIGEELARGFIRSFIGTTRKELIEVIAQGGVGGFLAARLTDLGFGTEDAAGIQAAADGLAKVDTELQKIADTFGRDPQIRALFGIDQGALGQAAPALTADQTQLILDFASNLQTKTAERIKQLRKTRGSIFDGLIGQPAVEDSISRARPAVAQAAIDFVEEAGSILDQAVSRLGEGLRPQTQSAIAALMAFIKEEIPRAFEQAGIKDEAEAAGRAAAKAAGEGVEEGKVEVREETPEPPAVETLTDFEQGVKDVVGQFDSLRQVGAALTAQLAAGVSGLIDLFFQANASFSQFAQSFILNLGKMIIQMALFRAISGAIGGFAGAGQDVPGGTTAASANRGGLAVPGGVMRLNRGTGFVPGPNVNRDMVPALLTPGEAVIQRPSVDYYSQRFMSALNNRLIPREAVKALLAQTASNSATYVQRRFQSGGTASASAATPGFIQGVLPIQQVDDDQMQTMLNTGKEGVFRFWGDNRETFRQALGIGNREF